MAEPAVTLLQQFVAALQRNSRGASNEAAFALLEQGAALREKWRLIAKVLQTNGELTAANRAMELFAEQSDDSPRARFEQAAVAAQTGRLSQAWAIMETVPADVPDRPGHEYVLGTMALNMGAVPPPSGKSPP
jgi:hypothetical protein